MVKLEPTRRKMPFTKLLIYLFLVLAVVMVLLGWSRISQFMQIFFHFSN
jgi:hypothetical protein